MTRDDLVAVVLPTYRRSASERRRTAIHEAGHAVAAWHLARARLLSVSMIETATTHGSVLMTSRDEALLVHDEIETEVVLALSGRAADSVVGDGQNAGAGGVGHGGSVSDLQVATRMLTDVHARFGLGPTLRHREAPGPDRFRMPDGEVARLVEADLRRLMARAEEATTARAGEVRAVAEALLGRDFMTAAEVGQVIAAV